MSFNKKIIFPEPPTGFSVKSVVFHPYRWRNLIQNPKNPLRRESRKPKSFYLEEIKHLKDQLAVKQNELLDQLNQRTEQLLDTLDKNLPTLVMEIVSKNLAQYKAECF